MNKTNDKQKLLPMQRARIEVARSKKTLRKPKLVSPYVRMLSAQHMFLHVPGLDVQLILD